MGGEKGARRPVGSTPTRGWSCREMASAQNPTLRCRGALPQAVGGPLLARRLRANSFQMLMCVVLTAQRA